MTQKDHLLQHPSPQFEPHSVEGCLQEMDVAEVGVDDEFAARPVGVLMSADQKLQGELFEDVMLGGLEFVIGTGIGRTIRKVGRFRMSTRRQAVRLLKRTDAASRVTCYGIMNGASCSSYRDGAGRPWQISHDDGTPTVTFTYNGERTQTVKNGPAANTYGHDLLNRVTSRSQVVNSNTYTHTATYRPAGGELQPGFGGQAERGDGEEGYDAGCGVCFVDRLCGARSGAFDFVGQRVDGELDVQPPIAAGDGIGGAVWVADDGLFWVLRGMAGVLCYQQREPGESVSGSGGSAAELHIRRLQPVGECVGAGHNELEQELPL